MDLLETDELLKIVNQSTEYQISKKLIREVPYFGKLLSHECLESKESKVELDFDEQAVKLFLNWIEFDHVLIEMKNVINLCTMIDYFGMDNNLINDYTTYFHDNFSTTHLPAVIPQVTPTSKLINSGALDAFICRHFLKIAGTKVWLNYSVETIEYICNKDLVIHSEMQVFNAIMKWGNFKPYSRKEHLETLLKLVRWCHLDDKDLDEIKENDFIKSANVEPIFCTPIQCDGECSFNRINQYYFVLIEELDGTDLQIKVLDRSFMSFIKRVIQLDESLPLHLLHNETVSDIIFDSGRKMIRVDWNQNKYRLLDLNDYKSHYHKINKGILEKTDYSLDTYCTFADKYTFEGSLLEFNEKFILVAENLISREPALGEFSNCYSINLFCWTAPADSRIETFFRSSDMNYLTTILNNKIYIMKDRCELIQFNIESQEMKKFRRKGTSDLSDLILTSMPVHDDKVILIDKSTKVVECFNVNDEEWTPFGLMSNICTSTGDQRKSNKLLTFTSASLPINTIRSCIKRERKSME
uniref:BACK domain-containing protein n=1 Tax=Tetranychus urticae TaxID=32264 RepID=T1JYA9_TETUR